MRLLLSRHAYIQTWVKIRVKIDTFLIKLADY